MLCFLPVPMRPPRPEPGREEAHRRLVEALGRGRRQVIRFDHRDTGQSSIVDFDRQPYTLTDMTADTLAVLDGHQIEAAHIAGASLAAATAPATVIHGTADPLRPPAHGQALATQLPNARFHPVPGMGHSFFSPKLPPQIVQLILARSGSARLRAS